MLSFYLFLLCLNIKVRVSIPFDDKVFLKFSVHFIYVCLELVNQCQHGEKQYIPGESYIKGNCTQNCSCTEVRYVGHVEQCVPLCPSTPAKCFRGTIPEFYQEDINGSACSCIKWRCVEGLLKYFLIFSMRR